MSALTRLHQCGYEVLCKRQAGEPLQGFEDGLISKEAVGCLQQHHLMGPSCRSSQLPFTHTGLDQQLAVTCMLKADANPAPAGLCC